jgi:hypothetical protein
MNIKKRMKINKKKIKIRKTWTRNPNTQIEPNRKKEDELRRGQKITEEDMDYYNDDYDFERGLHD